MALSVPSFLSVSGSPITSSGTISITATSTGSGSVVLATSPSITTPTITGSNAVFTSGILSVNNTSASSSTLISATTPSLTVGGQNIITVGQSAATNLCAQFGFQYVSSATPTLNYALVGVFGSTSGFRVFGSGETFTTGVSRMNDTAIQLRSGTNVNGIQYNATADGPNIFGNSGGALSTNTATILQWSSTGILVPVTNGYSVFGPASSTLANSAIAVRTSTTAFAELAQIGANANYSTTAVVGDTVLRSTGNLILQNGGAASAIRITSTSNNVEIRNNLAIGTTTANAPLQFSNAVVNRKVVLYDTANNDHQYYGFGVNGSALRYQVPSTTDAHVFYAAVNTTTSDEVFRISGTSSVSAKKYLGTNAAGVSALDFAVNDNYADMRVIRNSTNATDKNLYLNLGAGATSNTILYSNNSAVMTISGGNACTINGKIYSDDIYTTRGDTTGAVLFGNSEEFLYYNGTKFEFSKPLLVAGTIQKTVSWALYETSGSTGVAAGATVTIGNWSSIATSGSALSYNSGTGEFTNSLGIAVYFTISVSMLSDSPALVTYYIQDNSGRNWAISSGQGTDWYSSLTATIGLNTGSSIKILGFNSDVFGRNFTSGRLNYVIH